MFAIGLSCADAQEAMLRVLTRALLSNPRLAGETPTTDDILRVWRADRSLQESSVGMYLQWVRRFRAYCVQRNLEERRELTLDGVRRFAAWYAQRRHLHPDRLSGVRSALYALARVYQVMGVSMPVWQPVRPVHPPATALMRAFAEHLSGRCGNPETTVSRKLDHIGKLMAHLASQGKTWRTLKLSDIDEFVVACSQRYARSTVGDIASSIRSFARFLFATGRISVDLAASVMAPVQRRYERPRRALPWEDVQRLLRSIDTSGAKGLRDHALLLMMSTYGFGAGEVIRLRLEHIDWNSATLTVERPKTGVTFTLPLVPAVAKALARYLRNGRPPATPTKHLFVQTKMPFHPLSASSAVRHILVKHAKIAEFGVIRQLCLFRRRRHPASYVPEHAVAPVKDSAFQPYIFSHDEVRRILVAAASHKGRFLWAPMLRTLLLVLYCTGLRLGEAVRLRMADVDLDRGTLMVRHSKGRSRIVPIRADLVAELRRYTALRQQLVRQRRPDDAQMLFLRLDASPLTVRSASEGIRQLLRKLGMKPLRGRFGARPYEFRHAFAVHRLTAWVTEGADVHAKLPLLSAYLGHQSVLGTEVYLKATPQLLELASVRFEQHVRCARQPQ